MPPKGNTDDPFNMQGKQAFPTAEASTSATDAHNYQLPPPYRFDPNQFLADEQFRVTSPEPVHNSDVQAGIEASDAVALRPLPALTQNWTSNYARRRTGSLELGLHGEVQSGPNLQPDYSQGSSNIPDTDIQGSGEMSHLSREFPQETKYRWYHVVGGIALVATVVGLPVTSRVLWGKHGVLNHHKRDIGVEVTDPSVPPVYRNKPIRRASSDSGLYFSRLNHERSEPVRIPGEAPDTVTSGLLASSVESTESIRELD